MKSPQSCIGRDYVRILSAIFHDVIYISVDHALPPCAFEHIKSHVCINDLQASILHDAVNLDDLLTVFGYSKGMQLPIPGQNEFLSALLLQNMLGQFFHREHLIAMFVCIEATIPFRQIDPSILYV